MVYWVSYCVLLVFIVFYWFLLCFIGFYCVLLVFIAFYWFLLCFIGFKSVSLGFVGCITGLNCTKVNVPFTSHQTSQFKCLERLVGFRDSLLSYGIRQTHKPSRTLSRGFCIHEPKALKAMKPKSSSVLLVTCTIRVLYDLCVQYHKLQSQREVLFSGPPWLFGSGSKPRYPSEHPKSL